MNIKTIASSSRGNCYLIKDCNTSLLIECGLSIGAMQKAIDYKLHEVEGCLISHEHL